MIAITMQLRDRKRAVFHVKQTRKITASFPLESTYLLELEEAPTNNRICLISTAVHEYFLKHQTFLLHWTYDYVLAFGGVRMPTFGGGTILSG